MKKTLLNKTKSSQLKSNSNIIVKEKMYCFTSESHNFYFGKEFKLFWRSHEFLKLPLENENNNKTKSYPEADIEFAAKTDRVIM